MCSLYIKIDYAVEGWIFGNDKYEVEKIGKEICDLLLVKEVNN